MEPILTRPTPDEASRIAECAAMLIVVARLMLDAEPAGFAGWLRAIADDIEREASGPEAAAADA